MIFCNLGEVWVVDAHPLAQPQGETSGIGSASAQSAEELGSRQSVSAVSYNFFNILSQSPRSCGFRSPFTFESVVFLITGDSTVWAGCWTHFFQESIAFLLYLFTEVFSFWWLNGALCCYEYKYSRTPWRKAGVFWVTGHVSEIKSTYTFHERIFYSVYMKIHLHTYVSRYI